MKQSESGRWGPEPEPKPTPAEPTETERLRAICREGIAAGVEMPATYLLYHWWWYATAPERHI